MGIRGLSSIFVYTKIQIMNLFVNETHIFLTSQEEDIPEMKFDFTWQDGDESSLSRDQLKGKVFLMYPSKNQIREILQQIIKLEVSEALEVFCLIKGLKSTKNAILEDFEVIKAAGGLVTKEDKILMIYRLKKWDLPKGKVEKGEKRKEAAVREVEEECSIQVNLKRKLCTTWHYYVSHNTPILKQTKWYLMTCIADHKMKPQMEEDIEDLKWMNENEVTQILDQTYNTIRFVLDSYQKD